jgi:hypothetical protein
MCVPSAIAQPASFAAMRTIELEPALPGTEKVHRQLAERLAYWNNHPEPARDVYVRLEQSTSLSSGRAAANRDQRAKCTLRTDLPRPRTIGLECRDSEGRYIGTLRSRSSDELLERLVEYHLLVGGPDARPLTYYRFIHVKIVAFGHLETPPWAEDYVSDLLRVRGPWQVVASTETLSGDADDRLLECEVAPVVSATGPWWWPKTHSRMLLRNSAGQHVAAVVAGSSFGTRRALEALVRELLEQRRTDEEVYRVSPDDHSLSR